MRMMCAILALITVVACTPRIGSVPIVDPTCSATLVIIYLGGSRDELQDQMLIFNGQAVATLTAGSYAELSVRPGPHRLGIGRAVAHGLAWTAHDQMVLADPRTTYYFMIVGGSRQVRVQSISAEEGRKLLLRTTYPATANQSNKE